MKYLDYIRSKDPHDRRQHAMQLASGALAIMFMVWISTIGWRFASISTQTPNDTDSQIANVVNATSNNNGQAQLIVASTSNPSPYGAH